jgi:hypothetical protein
MEKTWTLLERHQNFSRSLLWEVQRRYFSESGIEAWKREQVPDYVTSNPVVARCYAEMILACWLDFQRLAPQDEEGMEPFYLCELGAGSGRFAFHLLLQLTRLCEETQVPPGSFRYVLTDFAQSNLDFWRHHPSFQPFFASNILDLALFDATQTEQLVLQVSGQRIGAGSLARPLVVIANYFFDSIPQDLFYIAQPDYFQCLVSLLTRGTMTERSVSQLFPRLHLRYAYQRLKASPYPEPALQRLFESYTRSLEASHLLFPATGLRCLQRLRALSKPGLLLLSADKGDLTLAALQGKAAPVLIHHGSFSLTVNYHAFQAFCAQQDGLALLPDRPGEHVSVVCLLFLNAAPGYTKTSSAYQRVVREYGPDDFYTISRHARQHSAPLRMSEMLAYIRMAEYDSHLLKAYLPRLRQVASRCSIDEREALLATLDQVWKGYFPVGEAYDLADQIARLCYDLDDYRRTLTYFSHSLTWYGPQTGIFYNMALCHLLQGAYEEVAPCLRQALDYDPTNQASRDLLAALLYNKSTLE